MMGNNMVEFNFDDVDVEYSVLCYTDIEYKPYYYCVWTPLEPALKYYEECLNESWTKRAVLLKRESYYYKERDKIVINYV